MSKYENPSIWRGIFIVPLVLFLAAGLFSVAGASLGHRSPFAARIVLSRTEIAAGLTIHGVVLITNSSTTSVVIKECGPRGWITVGIGSQQVPFVHVVGTGACFGTFNLRPGVSRFPISVTTTYQVCSQSNPSPGTPKCTGSNFHVGMPELPRGNYRTVLSIPGLPKDSSLPATMAVVLN